MSSRQASAKGPPRRAIGEGSIWEDGERFRGRLKVDGRTYYVSGASRSDVGDKLADLRRDLRDGLDADASRLKLAAFLDHWLLSVKRTRKRNTYRSYDQAVRVHIAPALGSLAVGRIRPHHIETWLHALAEKGLAESTQWRLYVILAAALEYAKDEGRLMQNPARRVRAPRVERREVQPLTTEQILALRAAIEAEPGTALYAFILGFGVRRGEALGLRWQDVDLEARTVHIRQQLQDYGFEDVKRDASRRVLKIPPWLVDVLRRHRIQQREARILAGGKWHRTGLVFPNTRGKPWRPAGAWLAWSRFLARHELPHLKLHQLRHTAAALLIQEGVDLFKVSRTLGHADIGTTANLYGHMTEQGRDEVAAAMERSLGSG